MVQFCKESKKRGKLLTVNNITKRYLKTIALNDVSFKVPEASITGIIGPNGAGKSTLLEIISGFQNPDSGEIHLNDKPLKTFYEKRQFFSYMPECLLVYPDYSVRDFIKFIHKATNYVDRDLITMLHLGEVMDKRICHLSKGFHQRLKLFFALSNRKKVLILDEPFDGFDPIQLIDILKFIKAENQKGRTFILSIHQLHQAEKICTYYVLLNEGKVLTGGNMQTLQQTFNGNNISLEEIFIKVIQ